MTSGILTPLLLTVIAVLVYNLFSPIRVGKEKAIVAADQLNATYDYIVVGSGSAGAVLANRLTEDDDVTVLLVEAGDDDRGHDNILYPSMMTRAWISDTFTRKFYSEPQNGIFRGLQDQRSYWPRGVVLGGTSSINGMMYVRGNRRDFDRWAQYTGDQTWDYRHVLPYFKKSEGIADDRLVKSRYHSTDGPLKISVMGKESTISNKIIQAFQEIGYPYNPDYNGQSMEGISHAQANMYKRQRWSSAMAYIHPILERPNLHVTLKTYVLKVVIDDKSKTVTGVDILKDNRKIRIGVTKEVILSAGAVQSPQILMLSGVGPAKKLQDLGIPVKADLPVGENLQDHLFVYLPVHISEPISNNEGLVDTHLAHLQHLLFNSGPLGQHAQENLFFSSTTEETKSLDWPDLELHFFSRGMSRANMKAVHYDPDVIQELGSLRESSPHGWVCCPSLLRPQSMGRLTIRSSDPFDDPVIIPNYLEKKEDLQLLLRGVEVCKKAVNSSVMAKVGARLSESKSFSLCQKHQFDSPAYWECYIRATLLTIYHPAGTCKMGGVKDKTSVVDSSLRVKGVNKLRVIDASVMPYIVSANPHASIVMLAEKAADMVRGRSPLPPEDI